MTIHRLTLPFLLALLVLSGPVRSEGFAEWREAHSQAFSGYVKKQDAEFARFLKQTFVRVKAKPAQIASTHPKPKVVPVLNGHRPTVQSPKVREAPRELAPSAIGDGGTLNFFGTTLSVRLPAGLRQVRLPPKLSSASIAAAWQALAGQNTQPLLQQLQRIRRRLQLNDWGYVELLRQVAAREHPHSSNSRTMLSWYLLAQSGYRSRVAYQGQRLFLLLPFVQPVYGIDYLQFGGRPYYVLGAAAGRGTYHSPDADYPPAHRYVDLALAASPRLPSRTVERQYIFSFKGKTYHLHVALPRGTVDFLDSVPQSDLALVATARPTVALRPLLAQLAPLVDGMAERDALNLLLRFVQSAFRYERDEQQFGKENYLFVEETLYYPYSDCEDRAVLYAWLVRSLLGRRVVLLDYPGHVATAVELHGQPTGDRVRYQGHVYTVADPTYVNADLGMTMPRFRNTRPTIIASGRE